MKGCTCSEAEPTPSSDQPRCTRPENSSLVTIDSQPFVAETPPVALQSWLTPNPLFFVRSHFSAPPVELSGWSISIEGQVSHPLRLTYSEIQQAQKHTVPITLECAGNDRSDLHPPAPGNQFGRGAVGTAVWAGVPLKAVLELAGIRPGAIEVLFEGADSGEPEPGKSVTPYLRSLPIDVAMDPDTLLAYEMNGEILPREHGYPLRLVVPGWYGVASVKWLRRICVLDYRFEGFFQTERYVLLGGDKEAAPVRSISVKSLISWPHDRAALPLKVHWVSGLLGRDTVICARSVLAPMAESRGVRPTSWAHATGTPGRSGTSPGNRRGQGITP